MKHKFQNQKNKGFVTKCEFEWSAGRAQCGYAFEAWQVIRCLWTQYELNDEILSSGSRLCSGGILSLS